MVGSGSYEPTTGNLRASVVTKSTATAEWAAPTHGDALDLTQEELTRLVQEILPPQGQWSQDDYLWLTSCTSRCIEFTDGRIEVLPMPTDEHQSMLAHLYEVLSSFLRGRGGKVLFAPLRLRIREGKFREPDLVAVRDAGDTRRQSRFWLGADLVVEIVSPDHPARDLIDKRLDYAEARIPEYWIVDPRARTLTVLELDGSAYAVRGVHRRGARAASVSLDGLSVDVDAIFDAAGTPAGAADPTGH